jgi:hypothetical protein
MLKGWQAVSDAEFRQEFFPVMPERGVTEIVAQGDSLNKVFIKSQETADGPGYPGYELDMEDPVGDVVVVHKMKNLGFVNIPYIGAGMEDSVRIKGELLPVSRFFLRKPSDPPVASGGGKCKVFFFIFIKFFQDFKKRRLYIYGVHFIGLYNCDVMKK